ncbi:MAG: ribosomal protein S18 acetylase RimI-like enzyme [Halobacteriales archaeon]|jgi:ribosomal protein S18 acetylase RimI-like enzyme
MDVRQATVDDAPEIKNIARASLLESYDFLDEDMIDGAMGTWYGKGKLEEMIEGDDVIILVTTKEDDVVGYAESEMVDRHRLLGEIRWLHVHPDHREEGVGAALVDGVEEILVDRGAEVFRAVALERNEAGIEFFKDQGFVRVGVRSVEIDDQPYTEIEFESKRGGGIQEVEPGLESTTAEEGETVFVDFDAGLHGSRSEFYPAYLDRSFDTRYGWFCSNCESFDVAMDSMDRLECNNCRNARSPTRWDAAWL